MHAAGPQLGVKHLAKLESDTQEPSLEHHLNGLRVMLTAPPCKSGLWAGGLCRLAGNLRAGEEQVDHAGKGGFRAVLLLNLLKQPLKAWRLSVHGGGDSLAGNGGRLVLGALGAATKARALRRGGSTMN